MWFDGERAVVHLGDRLVVGGEEMGLTELDNGHIHERGWKMDVSLDRPLTNKEGKAFIELCRALKWKSRIQSGTFLAGGVAVASVCGGLAWRTHVWITGEAGSGKSWTLENIVKPALGPMALLVQGKTSESRHPSALHSDALAVVRRAVPGRRLILLPVAVALSRRQSLQQSHRRNDFVRRPRWRACRARAG